MLCVSYGDGGLKNMGLVHIMMYRTCSTYGTQRTFSFSDDVLTPKHGEDVLTIVDGMNPKTLSDDTQIFSFHMQENPAKSMGVVGV